MKVIKLFGFGSNSPFKSQLFNDHTNHLFGKDGLLNEVIIEQRDSNIFIKNLLFVHKGIIVQLDEVIERNIPERYLNKSCVLVASVSDNTNNSEIIFDFISLDDDLQSRVIIARYDGIEWFSEEQINSNGIIKKMEEIFKTLPISFNKGLNLSITSSIAELSPGEFLNKDGKLVIFKKKREFPLPKLDQSFPNRMDVILYKKGVGLTSTGSFNFICGPTISGLPNEKNSSNPVELITDKGISSINIDLLPDDKLLHNFIYHSTNENNTETCPKINATALSTSLKNINPSTSLKTLYDKIYIAYNHVSTGIKLAIYKNIINPSNLIYHDTKIPISNKIVSSVSLETDRFSNNYIMLSSLNEFKKEYYLSIISNNLTDIVKNFLIDDNAFDLKFKIDSQIRLHFVFSTHDGLKYKSYSILNNQLKIEKELLIDNESLIFDIKIHSEKDPLICFAKGNDLNIYNINTSETRTLNFDYKIIKFDFTVNDLGWIHFLTCDETNTIRQFDYSLLNKNIEKAIYTQTESRLGIQIFDIKIAKENHGSLSIVYSNYNFNTITSQDIKATLIAENVIDGRKLLHWQALVSENEFKLKNISPSSGDFLKFSNREIRRIQKVALVNINTTSHYLLDFDFDKVKIQTSQNTMIQFISNKIVPCKLMHRRLPGLGSYIADDFFKSESKSDIIHSVIERQNNTIHKRTYNQETKVGNQYFFKYAYNKEVSGNNANADQTSFSDIGGVVPDKSCTKAVSIPVELLNKKNINVTVEIIDESSLPQNAFNCLPKIVLDKTTYGISWEFSGEKSSILISFHERPCFEKSWSELKNMGIKYRVLFTENSG